MINCASYYIMQSQYGYSQYPFDSLSDIYHSYEGLMMSDSQIVVHRQQSIVYYTYLRRLSGDTGSFFGVSILINGLETHSFRSLFRLFDKVFQRMVSDDIVLSISSQGDFVCKVQDLPSCANYLDEVSGSITRFVNEGEGNFTHMFPLSVSSGIDNFCQISIGVGENELLQKLYNYNKLVIIDEPSSSGAGLRGLALKLRHLSQQLEYQQERNSVLEQQVSGGGKDMIWKKVALSFICITLVVLLTLLYSVVSGLITINI